MQFQVHHPVLEPLKKVLEKDDYHNGVNKFLRDYPKKYRKRNCGITTLCGSPRQRYLKERHNRDIMIDADNRVNLLLGTSFHEYVRRKLMRDKNCQVEKRLGYIEPEHDYLVHHAFDLYHNGYYVDWKVIKQNRTKYENKGWEAQVNFGAFLIEKVMNLPVNEIYIIGVLKDWSPEHAHLDSYPSHSFLPIQILKWESDVVEEYINVKVGEHLEECEKEDDDLKFCTDEERLKDPTYYKVFPYTKKGNLYQRGVGEKFLTESAAQAYCRKEKINRYEIKTVHPEPRKCKNYCEAAKFCNQWAKDLIPF